MSCACLTRRDALFALGGAGLTAAGFWARGRSSAPKEVLPLPQVSADTLNLDPQRLDQAYRLLDEWTQKGDVPGGAILVGRHGRTVAPRVFGKQGPESGAAAIRADAIFLLASITKPIVYLAGLQLVDRGQLLLNERVSHYLPEFANHQKGDVLVSHLFTHTSGLPDMLPNNEELRRQHAPLQAFLDSAVRDTELAFKPGTNHKYQSMGTAVVAELIQKLTGKKIADVLQESIFDPLGLKSTRLGSKGLDAERIVRVQVPDYQRDTDFGWNSTYWRELGAPWGGMFSTPSDFAVLCQVLLSGGAYAGVRLLSPTLTRMATTSRYDDYPELPEPIRRTQPWGLGWRMNHPGTRGSWGDALGRHVFGHTGATGTMTWMDPRTGGFCILFTTAIRERAPWRLVQLSNLVAAAFR